MARKRRRRARLVLVLASTACTILFAEILLQLLTPAWLFSDPYSDLYWKLRLRDIVRSDTTPHTANVEYDSALGWRRKRRYEKDSIRHNSRGYRGARDYEPDPDRLRILAIGDSQTYGLFIPDESTYCSQLERIAGAEVINTGVTAYGVDQAMLMWEQEGMALNPSIVLLGYFVDDFHRNALSVRDRPKPHFVLDAQSQQFQLQGVPVPTFETLATSGELDYGMRIRLVDLVQYTIRRVRRGLAILDHDKLRRRERLSEYLLTRLRDSVEAAGAELIVVFIGHSFEGKADHRWIETSVTEFCQSRGIDCINLAAAMRESDYASFYDIGHLNEAGHLIAAETIAARITAHQTTGLDSRSSETSSAQ